MTRCLRLERRNRNTLTNQLVHERTFTYIGVTNDIYEPCLMSHFSLLITHFSFGACTIIRPLVIACSMNETSSESGHDDIVTLLQQMLVFP